MSVELIVFIALVVLASQSRCAEAHSSGGVARNDTSNTSVDGREADDFS